MSLSKGSFATSCPATRLRRPRSSDVLFLDLRAAIVRGDLRPGDRVASLRELASQYGVSVPTARAVIGRLQQQSLVESRHRSGIFVTDTSELPFAAQKMGVACRHVPLLVQTWDRLYNTFAEQLTERLLELDLMPMRLSFLRRSPERNFNLLNQMFDDWRRSPPRAVVLQMASERVVNEVVEACGGRSLIVEACRPPATPVRSHRVNPDYTAGYHMVAEHLYAQGHRRIGFVTHGRSGMWHDPLLQRKRTTGHSWAILKIGRYFRQRGHRHAITILHNLETYELAKSAHDTMALGNMALAEENIQRATAWLDRPDRPTAVFGDDNRIVGVIRAAERLGLRLGEDLTVVGQGNTEWSHAFGFPSLDWRMDILAQEVSSLIERAASRGATSAESRYNISVHPRLVMR